MTPLSPLLISGVGTVAGVASLVPRPSPAPVFDRLQYAKTDRGGRRPGESYHVIRGTNDVTGSRHEDIFTFISPATEKLEKQDKF